MASNVMLLLLKQTFSPIIWIFSEGVGIKSRLSFKTFSTLNHEYIVSDWVSDEHRIFQEYENDQNNIRCQLNDYENQSYKLFGEGYTISSLRKSYLCICKAIKLWLSTKACDCEPIQSKED